MDKDIRYSAKKVDEGWKQQASKEMGTEKSKTPRATSRPFTELLTSLELQAMMHLGEVPAPETGERELNLDAARQIIDLLRDLQTKTQGNLSDEEAALLNSLLPELQMKFARHV